MKSDSGLSKGPTAPQPPPPPPPNKNKNSIPWWKRVHEAVTSPSITAVLVIYGLVVCIAMVVNTVIFSVNTMQTTHDTTRAIASSSLSRVEQQIFSNMRNTERNTADLAGAVMARGDLGPMDLTNETYIDRLGDTFDLLTPPGASTTVITQEELWWHDKLQTYVGVGCHRSLSRCWAHKGKYNRMLIVVHNATSTSYDFENAVKIDSEPFYYSLQVRELQQAKFTSSVGQWSPMILRQSRADTVTTTCKGKDVEYVMLVTSCILLDNSTKISPLIRVEDESGVNPVTVSTVGLPCLHAVITTIELTYMDQLDVLGVSLISKVGLSAVNKVDYTNGACNTSQQLRDAMTNTYNYCSDSFDGSAAESTCELITIGSRTVTAGSVLWSRNGLSFIFVDITPTVFFFGQMERVRNVSIIITSVVIFIVIVVSIVLWGQLSAPLRRICAYMRKAASTKPPTPRRWCRCGPSFAVHEVTELYNACQQLDTALRELKAFAPQGLVVTIDPDFLSTIESDQDLDVYENEVAGDDGGADSAGYGGSGNANSADADIAMRHRQAAVAAAGATATIEECAGYNSSGEAERIAVAMGDGRHVAFKTNAMICGSLDVMNTSSGQSNDRPFFAHPYSGGPAGSGSTPEHSGNTAIVGPRYLSSLPPVPSQQQQHAAHYNMSHRTASGASVGGEDPNTFLTAANHLGSGSIASSTTPATVSAAAVPPHASVPGGTAPKSAAEHPFMTFVEAAPGGDLVSVPCTAVDHVEMSSSVAPTSAVPPPHNAAVVHVTDVELQTVAAAGAGDATASTSLHPSALNSVSAMEKPMASEDNSLFPMATSQSTTMLQTNVTPTSVNAATITTTNDSHSSFTPVEKNAEAKVAVRSDLRPSSNGEAMGPAPPPSSSSSSQQQQQHVVSSSPTGSNTAHAGLPHNSAPPRVNANSPPPTRIPHTQTGITSHTVVSASLWQQQQQQHPSAQPPPPPQSPTAAAGRVPSPATFLAPYPVTFSARGGQPNAAAAAVPSSPLFAFAPINIGAAPITSPSNPSLFVPINPGGSESVEFCPVDEAPAQHVTPHAMTSGVTTPAMMASAGTTAALMPTLSRRNSFRSVSCSFLLMRHRYNVVQTPNLDDEVNALMHATIDLFMSHGGVIEIFRPDLLGVSFGAHMVDTQHIKRATRCAIRVFRRLSVAQRRHTIITVDSGLFHIGTCGAFERYARVIFGDRLNFNISLSTYSAGFGKILLTDRAAAGCSRDLLVPVDNIMPILFRATQLYQLVDPRDVTPDVRASASIFREAFTAAVNGRYTEALELLKRKPVYDPRLRRRFALALQSLINSKPLRPRYCRFELPSFEVLGMSYNAFTAGSNTAQLKAHKHITVDDLDAPAPPHIDFMGLCSSDEDADAKEAPKASDDTHPNGALKNRNVKRGSGSGVGMGGTANGNGDAAAHDDVNATLHGTLRSTLFGVEGGESFHHQQRLGMSAATATTSATDDVEAPLMIRDSRGERWHRMPNAVGRGAFAEVYKAISESGSLAALKCIRLGDQHVHLDDVVAEVNTACKLYNEHVVNYSDWVSTGTYLIIMMEYMSGGTWEGVISAFPNGVALMLAKRYAADALKGLAYLHRNNIVHADLKPQNILISVDGACKISDFGSSVTKANAKACGGAVFNLRGTPLYMSPEVAAGAPPSKQSDIFSFGITLYEMLTGKLPWVMAPATTANGVGGAKEENSGTAAATASAAMPNGTPSADGPSDALHHLFTSTDLRQTAGQWTVMLRTVQRKAAAAAAAAGGAGGENGNRAAANTAALKPSLAQKAGSQPPSRGRVEGGEGSETTTVPFVTTRSTYLAMQDGADNSTARRAKPNAADAVEADVIDFVSATSRLKGEKVHDEEDTSNLGVARFLQGVAKGTIVIRVRPEELPTHEAYDLIVACLNTDPSKRPRVDDIPYHGFFY